MSSFLHRQQNIEIFSTTLDIIRRDDDTAEEAQHYIANVYNKNYGATSEPDPDIKELTQLAEIEMHVATVMTRILCELQAESTPFKAGNGLYHAFSCFASEEINHANSFYQYVRHLSGRDIKLENNLFAERVALYNDNDAPLIKLAALCSTAYIGESVITVFERRLKVPDPMQRSFLTQLLHFHGLDEARHIQCEHAIFEQIIPTFNAAENRRSISTTPKVISLPGRSLT